MIKANIKGVRTSDRSKINGQYLIIQVQGTGFLVQSDDGRIYKASTEPDAQIFLEEITADVGRPAITNIEALTLEDEPIGSAIAQFNRTGAMVFVTGQLTVDGLETGGLPRDPYQFLTIKATDTSITLEIVGKGTGLGLSISYQIVTEKHQGKLQYHSTFGKGTEFVMAIPLNQQRQQAA